jgi:uncharacterized protein YdeI (YjbR/CyaY-like superfamily)
MPSQDPRIDAYIAKAAPFAQPILEKLRAIVHEACLDAGETMKWSMPCFMHAGGILCSMAAFKQHVSFGFWKHALVMGEGVERDGMGSFGKMASTRDLPPKKDLLAWIRKAMRLNEQGVKTPGARKAATPKPSPVAPGDLAAALKKNKAAAATFKAFPPSQQREYIEWLTEAKREETRAKRLAQAIEWLAEGKPRNWKYMNC